MEIFAAIDPLIRKIMIIIAVPLVFLKWIRYVDGVTGWWLHGDFKQKVKAVIVAILALAILGFLGLQLYKW